MPLSCCQVVVRAIASAELKFLSCKYIIHYLILYIAFKVPIYSIQINILLTCCFTGAGFSSFSSLCLLLFQHCGGQTELYWAAPRKEEVEGSHQLEAASWLLHNSSKALGKNKNLQDQTQHARSHTPVLQLSGKPSLALNSLYPKQ